MEEEIKKLLDEQKVVFEEFKAKNDQELTELREKGSADVIVKEHTDRLNAEITALKKKMDDLAVKASRPRAGGDVEDPDRSAHKKAFDTWMRKGRSDELDAIATKAMQGNSDPDGGYLVPVEYERSVERVVSTISRMREVSTVRTISSGSLKKPVTTTAGASGWIGETDSRPETTAPKLSELTFQTMELYANPAVTQTLLDDAYVNLEQWLADEVSIVFAEAEGVAFVTGNGIARPRGFLSYDTVANASYAWGKLGFVVTGAAADFDTTVSATANPADELIDLQASLKPQYRPGAVFMMNRTVESKIRKFKDTTGLYIWQPPLQVGNPASLLGHPALTDDNMPDVGANTFPVAFGDFRRGYMIVDRAGIRVLRDPYSAKPYVHFYTTKRVGGGVQNFEAIKLLKCST